MLYSFNVWWHKLLELSTFLCARQLWSHNFKELPWSPRLTNSVLLLTECWNHYSAMTSLTWRLTRTDLHVHVGAVGCWLMNKASNLPCFKLTAPKMRWLWDLFSHTAISVPACGPSSSYQAALVVWGRGREGGCCGCQLWVSFWEIFLHVAKVSTFAVTFAKGASSLHSKDSLKLHVHVASCTYMYHAYPMARLHFSSPTSRHEMFHARLPGIPKLPALTGSWGNFGHLWMAMLTRISIHPPIPSPLKILQGLTVNIPLGCHRKGLK